MLITKLKLKGYKRLMLNNLDYFEYTPTSPYQIILGTNGSGKSSILEQLSPLPAEKDDFVSGGYKEIHVSHNGEEYVLISTFKSGNKHNFFQGDVELNTGGTLTVQRELVRRIFNYWSDLHELLLGRKRFTTMDAGKRREWITTLSAADYTYPLGVFDRLKTSARDTKGALKHDRMRLGQETQNLAALGDLEQVRQQCADWREELNLLLISRSAKVRTALAVEEDFAQLEQLTDRIGAELLRSVPCSPNANFNSLQDVGDHLTRVTQEISSVRQLLEHYSTEYSELEEITEAIGGEVLDISALELKHADFVANMELKRAGIQNFHKLEDPESILVDTQTAIPALIELFESLPNNSERVFTKDKLAQAREDLEKTLGVLSKQQSLYNFAETRLEQMAEAKNEQCPKCKYIWRPGYSEVEENDLIKQKDRFNTGIGETKKEVARLETYIEQAEEYTQRFLQFKRLTQSYPRLSPLWDDILEKERHLNYPRSHLAFFQSFQNDVFLHAEIVKLERDASHLIDLLERDKIRRGDGSQHFEERLGKLKESIARTTVKLQALNTEQTQTRTFHGQVKRWQDGFQQLEQAWIAFPSLYQERIEVERVSILDRVTSRHQSQLASAEQKITKQTTLQGIVADLEKSQTQLALDMEAYQTVLKALSPTEGLIADLLNGFIACLTAQVNSVIAAVWTYDLQVLPCGNESGELNYKFPLSVQTGTTPVADINEGSTAMMEIVDFAFKVTVMLYLGMREFPLYLDEIGATFDEQHRTNIMNFIKRLVDTGYHRQVYLISHYASGHGAFTNAEILVMDSRNVVVPKEHNQHVIMS